MSVRSFLIREKQIPFTLVFTCHDVRLCERGSLENSDLETSDREKSENSDLENSDPLKND